jgi:uncharacterized membrane protein
MGISDNLSDSFSYAIDGLVGKWGKWIILIIGSIIFPILAGYSLRVLKGVTPAPDADGILGMFIDGIKMYIIGIVYMIIPCIIGFVMLILTAGSGMATLAGMNASDPMALFGFLLGSVAVAFIIWAIFTFIFGLFEIIGMIRFARSGSMGEAFAFSEILAKIGTIGWVSYIVALIVLMIVMFVIYFILAMIPIIGMLLILILGPLLTIVSSRYQSNLYDLAG